MRGKKEERADPPPPLLFSALYSKDLTTTTRRLSSFGEQSRTVSDATAPSAMDVAASDEIREIIKVKGKGLDWID